MQSKSGNNNSNRIYLIDNTKVILIILVVFAHFLEAINSFSSDISILYRAIYIFHMPALIFLAGFNTKSQFSKQRVIGLLFLYIIFQTLYSLLINKYSILTPHWIMWFIPSLIFWRLSIHLFKKTRYPFTIAIILAIISGYFPIIGYPLSLSRTFVFLPFFILGHFHGERILLLCRKYNKALILPVGIAAISVSSYFIIDVRWLYSSFSYQSLGAEGINSIIMRTICLVSSTIGIITLLTFIPDKKFTWSSIGTKILPIYLLHGFFVISLKNVVIVLASYNIAAAVALAAVSTYILVKLLSSEKISKIIYAIYNYSSSKKSVI